MRNNFDCVIGKRCIPIALSILFFASCSSPKEEKKGPNVILIMADDMGAEALACYGNMRNKTPNLDAMASQGILFDNCISQPLCTPSRVKIMTGKYNYRNYTHFGYLNPNEYTFGNLFKDNGYATCIAGKWQLNGIYNKDEIDGWADATKPNKFGFQQYCLWQLTKDKKSGERYADPLIQQNGEILKRDKEAFGPDLFTNFIIDFIKEEKDKPFFVYYPMVLVHAPFVPTPDSKNWEVDSLRYKQDTTYFKDMVEYADKLVGKIIAQVEAQDFENETLIIFTGDNGTHTSIVSQTADGSIRGAKANTIDAGVHVPLIARWIGKGQKSFSYTGIIEFSDFFSTFEDLLGMKESSVDGNSFLEVLNGNETFEGRNNAFVHYDPKWTKKANRFRNQFVQTNDYKLYQDGSFYDIVNDRLEENRLPKDSLTNPEEQIRTLLENELSNHPKFN